MFDVAAIYELASPPLGSVLRVRGLLLGSRFDNLAVSDSVEVFDAGIALPILDDELYERLFHRGVYSIGGGRFGYHYQCDLEAQLSPGARGFRLALTALTSFIVKYRTANVSIISPTNSDASKDNWG